MKTLQYQFTPEKGFIRLGATPDELTPHLVLVFGGRDILAQPDTFLKIKSLFPVGNIVCCSTAGEILEKSVYDNSLAITAIEFEKTSPAYYLTSIFDFQSSYNAGKNIALALASPQLKHIFVLSDGQKVNGSELVRGITENISANVSVSGGLAGDGDRFEQTLIGLNAAPRQGNIAAIGFSGEQLKIGYGSMGGWDPFGPERLVTRSDGNILYELDGHSALDLYKMYLGPQAEGLPGTALLFPLAIKLDRNSKESIVRTVLSVNDKEKSMIFAGDIPEGSYARLMKANFDRLIDGATNAAITTTQLLPSGKAELAVLISCVGRKLVLSQRIDEEVEAVTDVLGATPAVTGFYSYGEISPFASFAVCELHNQTMTITTFSELE